MRHIVREAWRAPFKSGEVSNHGGLGRRIGYPQATEVACFKARPLAPRPSRREAACHMPAGPGPSRTTRLMQAGQLTYAAYLHREIGRWWVNERPLVWRVKRGLFHWVFVGLWVGLGTFAGFGWLRLARLCGHDGKMSAKPWRSMGSQTSASLRASGLAVCGCIHRPLSSPAIWTVVGESSPVGFQVAGSWHT